MHLLCNGYLDKKLPKAVSLSSPVVGGRVRPYEQRPLAKTRAGKCGVPKIAGQMDRAQQADRLQASVKTNISHRRRSSLGIMRATRVLRSPPGSSTSIPQAKLKYVPRSGSYPKGFAASGIWVGVKPGNKSKPDLALLTSDRPCAAAAVFTKNKFQAAPVTFSRKVLQDRANAGLRSVVVNSGCANAVTGVGGLEDAARMARTTDQRVGSDDSTLVMSTGVIGQRCVPRQGRPAWW